MTRYLVFIMLLISSRSFSQCPSQTAISGTAFQGQILQTLNSCISYPISPALTPFQAYSFKIVLHSNGGNCNNPTPPDCSLKCQIFLGYYPCDKSGQEIDISYEGGFPFPSTLTIDTVSFHSQMPFTYISIVYYYNTGQTYIGCPGSLVIDSFSFTSANAPFVNIQVNDTACLGFSNGQVTAHAEGEGPFTYEWSSSTGGSNDSILKNIAHGQYGVKVTSASGCSDSVSFDLPYITPLPIIITPISAGSDTLTVVNTEPSYQWYFDDTAVVGATSQTFIAQQNGYYSVLISDSNTDCLATGSFLLSTGVDVLNNSEISLYPNPASNQLVIHSASKPFTITLNDMTGKEVFSRGLNGGSDNLDVSQLARGIYMVKIQQGEKSFYQKLILE